MGNALNNNSFECDWGLVSATIGYCQWSYGKYLELEVECQVDECGQRPVIYVEQTVVFISDSPRVIDHLVIDQSATI